MLINPRPPLQIKAIAANQIYAKNEQQVPTDPSFAEHAAATNVQSFLSKYQTLASKLKINIVPGTIVTASPNASASDPSASILLNISTFISYTGEILGSYNKKNLWHPERSHLTSTGKDEEHTIIETPLGPVGILVCWDLAFPEAFRALVRQGAKIVIVPTFWMATDCSPEGLKYNPDAESLFLQTTLVARAFENTCCVIFVNAGGKADDGYCGLSQVAMPFVGTVKGSFDGPEEGMRIVEVDMEILEIAERNYKIRGDLAKEDWHYGYSHESTTVS
jgi:predicted amidohydrolase